MKAKMTIKDLQYEAGCVSTEPAAPPVQQGPRCLPLSELSPTQLDVLHYIKRYHADVGLVPTIREIGQACDITSTSHVNYLLQKLAEAGYIRRLGRKISRGNLLTAAGLSVAMEA